MYIRVPFHFNPIRELEWISAPSVYSSGKIPIEEKAHALYLHMAGLSSWEIADAMEDHYGRKPSHSSVLDWARAFGSVRWTIPPRERRPDRGGLERGRGEGERPGGLRLGRDRCGHGGAPGHMDALLFLSRVLGARTNNRCSSWMGSAVLVGLPGAGAAVLPRDVRGQEQG